MSDKKMKRDDLGNRMKNFYENITKTKLMRRTPVIIRIDGKAFHTFTKGFQRPFDDVLIKTMQKTAKYLCENIQGCQLAYTESDEISLLLIDYQKFETSAWFDYEVQKMCSISASMATIAFNKYFAVNFDEWGEENLPDWDLGGTYDKVEEPLLKLDDAYSKALKTGAMFDARVFNIPKEEVTNYFYWRQLDASRNSIQMVGQTNFSHKELQYKSCNDIQDMLMIQKGINWNEFPADQKRGSCVVRNKIVLESEGIKERCMLRNPKQGENSWIVDKDIPVFKGDGREYIERLVNIGEA